MIKREMIEDLIFELEYSLDVRKINDIIDDMEDKGTLYVNIAKNEAFEVIYNKIHNKLILQTAWMNQTIDDNWLREANKLNTIIKQYNKES
jgi:hypothetical protein